MDMHSLKMVDIVALTAVVLSVMCPASKSTHIVTCRWIYPAVTLYFIVHARKQLEKNLTCLQKIVYLFRAQTPLSKRGLGMHETRLMFGSTSKFIPSGAHPFNPEIKILGITRENLYTIKDAL